MGIRLTTVGGVRGSEPLIQASYGSLPETLLSDTRDVPRTLSSAARRRPTFFDAIARC